jgi:hypothetical protein
LVHGLRHPCLEGRQLSYPDLWHLVRTEGGSLTVAHPFRYRDTVDLDLWNCPPDAVEIHSVNTGRCHASKIADLARSLGVPTLATSDAHEAANVGVFHLEIAETVQSDADLVTTVRRGAFSIAQRDDRIRAINAEVELRESMIRDMLAAGQDKHFFRRMTGQWEGYFECVEQGNSYLI